MDRQDGYGVGLEGLAKVCEELERGLSPCFGPLGLDVLLLTATGQLLSTSSGITILESLRPEHPVAKLFLSCVSSFHKAYGDFSTTFTLLVAKCMNGILREVDKVGGLGRVPRNHRQLQLASAFNLVRDDVLLLLERTRSEIAIPIPASDDELVSHTVSRLLTTTTSGKFGPSATKYLVDILTDFIVKWKDRAELGVVMQRISDAFPIYSCKGALLHHSTIVRGELWEGSLASRSMPRKLQSKGKVAFFDCHIDGKVSEDGVITGKLEVSKDNVEDVILHRQKKLAVLENHLRKQGVVCVVCTGRVGEIFSDFCVSHGAPIMALDFVPKDAFQRMCVDAGVFPICRPMDCVSSSWDYPDILSCESFSLSGRNLVQLEVKPTCLWKAHTMIIRGQTESMAKLYKQAIYVGINSIRAWASQKYSKDKTSSLAAERQRNCVVDSWETLAGSFIRRVQVEGERRSGGVGGALGDDKDDGADNYVGVDDGDDGVDNMDNVSNVDGGDAQTAVASRSRTRLREAVLLRWLAQHWQGLGDGSNFHSKGSTSPKYFYHCAPGGCSVELLLLATLQRRDTIGTTPTQDHMTARRIVAEALFFLVDTLVSQQNSKTRLLKLLPEVYQAHNDSKRVFMQFSEEYSTHPFSVAIADEKGDVKETLGTVNSTDTSTTAKRIAPLESFDSKVALYTAVLDTVSHLLRIDQIVAVKRDPSKSEIA